jgi:alpha,alpha-trehalase
MATRTCLIDPDRYDAVVFDLDGVVTDTASVHLAAWRQLFDEYLPTRPAGAGEDRSPFTDADYRAFVDGRPRYDGVTHFLASRGITLDRSEVLELGERKDAYFINRLRRYGVQAFPSTVELVRELVGAGLGAAIVSSSRNCAEVLAAAGLPELFDVRVDGVVADELGLPGKPDPAIFLLAAHRLGVPPRRAVVVEDARSGVQAGHAGGFGLVIGVDRLDQPARLLLSGADVVVTDLAEVAVGVALEGRG